MSRESNGMVTFNDLIYMVNNEGYTARKTIPASNECATKTEITEYLHANISDASQRTSLQLVPYGKISPATVIIRTKVDIYSLGYVTPIDACTFPSGGATEVWHDGDFSMPRVGDTLYLLETGPFTYNGEDKFHKITDGLTVKAMGVGNDGIINDIGVVC